MKEYILITAVTLVFFVACAEIVPQRKVASTQVVGRDIALTKILQKTQNVGEIQVKKINLDLLQ